MLFTLIEKEIMHHVLSARFVALLLMCVLLIPLTLSTNYGKYQRNLVDYQESVKRARAAADENPPDAQNPDTEVAKLFLKPTPLSVFANGLEEALPSYLGMTRNGVRQGAAGLAQAPLSYALGNLDFLFVVGIVFSLLALLFTFDAVAGEREAGTIRITLSNPLPRDLFLWSKLIGGYLVFVAPFLVAFLMGLFVIVWQGFPLGEPDIWPRVLCLTGISLLYIAVFFAIGVLISTFFESSKTALIVAFTFWVFAVLIAPRAGFLAAKLMSPTQTAQSVSLQKTALRQNLTEEMQHKINTKMFAEMAKGGQIAINTDTDQEKLQELRAPIEEDYRQRFQNEADKLDREFQRQNVRQEKLGATLSRLAPTASLIYITMNLTDTGEIQRDAYFETGERYYERLEAEYFSNISDDQLAQIFRIAARMDTGKSKKEVETLPPAPELPVTSVSETLSHSLVDVLLLGFFAVVLTTAAFLKFFRSDI